MSRPKDQKQEEQVKDDNVQQPSSTLPAQPEEPTIPTFPDHPRPASFDIPHEVDGTFDVPGVVEVVFPVEVFALPARQAAKRTVEALLDAPSLVVAGDPRRTAKNRARYLREYAKVLASAVERII